VICYFKKAVSRRGSPESVRGNPRYPKVRRISSAVRFPQFCGTTSPFVKLARI